jgi:hypothetical protein
LIQNPITLSCNLLVICRAVKDKQKAAAAAAAAAAATAGSDDDEAAAAAGSDEEGAAEYERRPRAAEQVCYCVILCYFSCLNVDSLM